MKALHKGLLLAPLFAAFVAAPAAAQEWKWDWGVNVGWSHFTNSLGTDETGLGDGEAGSTVHFDNGILFGTQLGYWFNPKLGLRLNGRYADRDMEAKDFPNDVITSVNLWGLTADLLFRFKAPQPEFTKMEMLPYLALGLGAKWHNTGGDNFFCNGDPCVPFNTSFNTAFALEDKTRLAGLIGLGADWRLARSIALRTELSDQLFKPKIVSVTGGSGTTFTVGEDNQAKLTHELGIQLGLQFLFGIAAPPVVAVAPPPPPPPAAPPPAPEVRRESINVCVVDPTAPGGIRMQAATLIEGRDTVISVNGTDQPFSQSVGNVMVATNADWYVQGQPLTMKVGTSNVEFATYGTPRVVEATDLAFLGTVNGYPVYADRDDVADVIDELNDLNKAQQGRDLGEILNQQGDLREALEDVKVIYVPMNATGCVFQAVQRQEEVRKGGRK